MLTGDGDPESSNPRNIRVRARGGGLWRINDAHYVYDPLHFVLFHPHGEPDWHPNITGTTLAVVDGLSFEDEQQQPSEDEQQPNVDSARVGAGAVVGVGAEVEELPQGASLTRLLPGNTRLTSCMTATLPPTTHSLMARDYIKSGWLISTPRLRGSGCDGCASTRPPWVLTNIKEWQMPCNKTSLIAPTLGALWSFQPLLLVAPAT